MRHILPHGPISLRGMIIYIMGIPLLCMALLFIYIGYQKARAQGIVDLRTVLMERTARQASDLNLFFGRMSRYADTLAITLNSTGPLEDSVYRSLLADVLSCDGINGVIIAFDAGVFPAGSVPPSPMAIEYGEQSEYGIFSKEKDYDYAYSDWFLLPKLAHRGIWTDPSYSTLQNNMVCAYSAPFFHNKVLQGVVSVAVSVEEINRNLGTINVEGSQLILVSQFGTIVVHPDSDVILRHTLVSLSHERASPELVDFAYSLRNTSTGGVVRFDKGLLGMNEYIAYTPISHTNWTLLSVIPESVVLGPLMQSVWGGVYFVFIVSGLMFFCSYWLLTHELVQPLRGLQQVAHRFAEGQLQTQVDASSKIYEILCLEKAFNTMVGQVGESMAKEIAAGRARSYAEEASKAKSDFLARMSHEIRTPMSAILGLTHLALKETSPGQQYGYLRKIQRASKNMLAIINDILDFSKIEAGKLTLEMAPFRLEEIITTLEDMFSSIAEEKGLRFLINVDESVPLYLMGDALRLTQVLMNLSNNALKFTEQGSVTVCMRGMCCVDGLCMLAITVQDTGIGIAPEVQKQLFSKFSQADSSTTRKFGGTGLGLAICKLLVELMGGTISLESVVGRGSIFRVRVPLSCVPEDVDVPIATAHTPLPSIPPSTRILVAEDNDINQEIIVALLKHMGLSCRLVSNGKQALQALHEEVFDIVLMDIQMPEMDGLSATVALRSQHFTMPVLAMTANAMEEDKEHCRAAGMNAHIAKPIDPDILQSTIAFWLPSS
ncbi:MAG: ATP-binding protein [Desulfovibrionaceae bacterium]